MLFLLYFMHISFFRIYVFNFVNGGILKHTVVLKKTLDVFEKTLDIFKNSS